ncbi:sodium-coupled monocarboxylate transporter 2-like [Dermacentor albipictus]|uniref:sodium-coupled monocarboxylate transporter 2-like n=1 Tax=Dermacentor albipictus TaxID=60249 RepID=UPI0031FCE88B
MNLMKDLDVYDCVVFSVLTAGGYLVGLYFSLARRRRQSTSTDGSGAYEEIETFLGGKSLPAAALAVSVVASVANGVNVVGFVGHYYAYGFHSIWVVAGTVVALALTVTAVVPLLYGLRVASIFQYLRLRFDNKVGITACIVYFVLSQTLGAVGIYSAAVGISTMFPVPILYSNIIIGLAGTVYTALGGLRGVVWADCAQAFVMFLSPLTITAKVVYDSKYVTQPLRPISDMNVTEYMFRMNVDITSDDNFWTCLIGGLPYILVRMGFDQMVVQRYMAASNVRAAKIIAMAGAVFVLFFFLLVAIAAVCIIYWYRDCDPYVSGDISSYDQIVPYYIKESLSDIVTLRGLFLAGLLGATTSTVSSVVNSHAATFYIDVFGLYFKFSERSALHVMRSLAFASGTIMTLFAIAVPLMGTATGLFLSLYASASGPFAGLILLAISSPWVNAKGAAWSSLLVCVLQLWHAVGKTFFTEPRAPAFVGTLDRCPVAENSTAESWTFAATPHSMLTQSSQGFPLYELAFFWSSFIGALLTIFLGTAISVLTGGVKTCKDNLSLTSPLFLSLWRRFKFLAQIIQVDKEARNGHGKLLRGDEDVTEETILGAEISLKKEDNYFRETLA